MMHEGKRIGYVHAYEDPDKTFGLDLFIADTDYMGKGYDMPFIT